MFITLRRCAWPTGQTQPAASLLTATAEWRGRGEWPPGPRPWRPTGPGAGAQGSPPAAAESAGTPSGSRLACGGPASCARTSGWGRGRKSRGARGPRRCVPPAGPAATSPWVPVAASDGERGKARRPEGRTPGCGPRSQPACSRLQGFLPASSVRVNIRVAAPAAPCSVPSGAARGLSHSETEASAEARAGGGGQGWAPREAAHVPPLRVPLPASPGLGFSICQRFPLSVVTRTGDARGGGDARVQELIAHAGFGVTGGRGQWEHSACGSRSPAPLPAQHSDPGSGSLPGQRLGFSGWPGAPFLRFPHLSDSTPEGEVMRVHAEAAVTAVKCRSCVFTAATPAAWWPRPLGGDSR